MHLIQKAEIDGLFVQFLVGQGASVYMDGQLIWPVVDYSFHPGRKSERLHYLNTLVLWPFQFNEK